jgi:hypothetical protein
MLQKLLSFYKTLASSAIANTPSSLKKNAIAKNLFVLILIDA